MKLRWAALAVVLAFSALMPRTTVAQASGTQPPRHRGSLGPGYPNPFNPDNRVHFSVDSTCSEPGKKHRVTLRLYNLLAQVIAIPQIEGGTATVSGGQPIDNIELECGTYTAYWNGRYMTTNQEAASGVYIYRLVVDGRTEGVSRVLHTK
jgi:hypothetical protein